MGPSLCSQAGCSGPPCAVSPCHPRAPCPGPARPGLVRGRGPLSVGGSFPFASSPLTDGLHACPSGAGGAGHARPLRQDPGRLAVEPACRSLCARPLSGAVGMWDRWSALRSLGGLEVGLLLVGWVPLGQVEAKGGQGWRPAQRSSSRLGRASMGSVEGGCWRAGEYSVGLPSAFLTGTPFTDGPAAAETLRAAGPSSAVR